MKIVTHVIASIIGAATGIVATWIITNKKRDKEKEKLASRFNDQLAKLYSQIDALNEEISDLKAAATFRESSSKEDDKTENKKDEAVAFEEIHHDEETIEEVIEPEDITKLYPVPARYRKEDVSEWLAENKIDAVRWTSDSDYRQLVIDLMEGDFSRYEENVREREEEDRELDMNIRNAVKTKTGGYQQIKLSAWQKLCERGYESSVVDYYPRMYELYNKGYMDTDTGLWIDDVSNWGDYVINCIETAAKANTGSNLRTLMFVNHAYEQLLMVKIWVKDTFPLDEETKEIGGEKD